MKVSFLARIFHRKIDAPSSLVAVRMFRSGHHYYTILASDSGFEYVFQSGKERWSTISPSLATRLINKNKDGKIGGRPATNRKQFLELAIGISGDASSSWVPSEEFVYLTRSEALATEREILDASWARVKEELGYE